MQIIHQITEPLNQNSRAGLKKDFLSQKKVFFKRTK